MAQDSGAQALGVAQRAQRTAEEAKRAASEAREFAQEALKEIRALEQRTTKLEQAMESLIRMLHAQMERLVDETKSLRQSVIAEGKATQDRIGETTKSVHSGFSGMSKQQTEGRLRDSKTAIMGLVAKLSIVQTTLEEEHKQAKRRSEEQRDRFRLLAHKTKESLDKDFERVGREIVRIKDEHFEPLVARSRPSAGRWPSAFSVEEHAQTASANLKRRSAALEPHLEKLSVGLDALSANRSGLLRSLQSLRHDRLEIPPGRYALRVYFTGNGSTSDCLVGADVGVESGAVTVKRPEEGLERMAPQLAAAWDRAHHKQRATLTQAEVTRLRAYLAGLQTAGVLTAGELSVLDRHVTDGHLELVREGRAAR